MTRRLLPSAVLLLVLGCASQVAVQDSARVEFRVPPDAETAPVISRSDSADDPAIWINPRDPAASLVVGTDKRSGLYVYKLDGSVHQYLPLGNPNNVDLRTMPWGDRDLTLVAASGRFPSELLLLALDHEDGQLRLLRRHEVNLREPYGICMYQDRHDQPYIFLNSTDGSFVQYAVDRAYEISAVRRFRLRSQVEGCVVDDDAGVLYIAEEDRGIWTMSADPEADDRREILDTVRSAHLAADVEGLALYRGARKLLVASSQGDDSYAIYDVESRQYLLSFRIAGDTRIDDVSDTDGLDVTGVSLPGYPGGLLVVQDGNNSNPDENQNFKFVSWRRILDIVERTFPAGAGDGG